MNPLIDTTLQIIACIFSASVWFYSLKGLNNCTKDTACIVRLLLIMYFTGSTGSILVLLTGQVLEWHYVLFTAASSFHLASDRRKISTTPSPKFIR